MNHNQFQWVFPEPVPETINANLDSFSCPFRSVLYRRGCKTSQDAVSYLLPQDPAFPRELDLGHLDLACDLIKNSINSDQKIAVYGDYDVDGITATALLALALRNITSQVSTYIPNRLSDGYGLNKSAIDSLHQQGIDLLITVDNGIRSNPEVSYANSLGMKVIITDHHQPSDPLPDAFAIINPKLPGDPYPNKNLAGVGVAYKLVCRLGDHFSQINPCEYLDLVALGTIADIVPLSGENRYLVKQGLIQINQRQRQSLLSIIGTAGLQNKIISASDISYQIAPRINSSSRLSNTNHLVPLDLLLSTNPAVCGTHAQIIEIHNDRRKRISQDMQERLDSLFSSQESLPPILISFDPENVLGVAGITAGHLTRKYYLPTIIGTVGERTTTASCRSIPEFDIISALNDNSDLFIRFGGHKLAAGFTVENDHLAEVCERMTALAENKFSKLDLRPQLEIDAVVSLSDLQTDLHRELQKLEPTGEGNPTPVFVVREISTKQLSRVGKKGDHLKFIIDDGEKTMPAIAFGLGRLADAISGKIDVAFNFTENEYRGKKEYQLQVLDIKPS